jgi:hypothetical protein
MPKESRRRAGRARRAAQATEIDRPVPAADRARPTGGASAAEPFPAPTSRQKHERLLLSLAATSLLDTGRWQDLATLQRKRMGGEEPVALADIADTLAPEVASLDTDRVLRVTVRGLSTVSAGGQVLRNFPAAVELAVRRFRKSASTLTLRQLKRAMRLTRGDARILGELLDAEGNIFLAPARSALSRFDRRRRWRIADRVSLYEGVSSVRQYLAVQRTNPVLAAARPTPPQDTSRSGGLQAFARAVMTQALGQLIGAGLFGLVVLIVGYLALR